MEAVQCIAPMFRFPFILPSSVFHVAFGVLFRHYPHFIFFLSTDLLWVIDKKV